MKMREEFTCPLEITHDMIKGKWKPIILWLLRTKPSVFIRIGKGGRRHFSENVVGAFARADSIWLCSEKRISQGIR
jgi:hypothetical protein